MHISSVMFHVRFCGCTQVYNSWQSVFVPPEVVLMTMCSRLIKKNLFLFGNMKILPQKLVLKQQWSLQTSWKGKKIKVHDLVCVIGRESLFFSYSVGNKWAASVLLSCLYISCCSLLGSLHYHIYIYFCQALIININST